MIYLLEDDDSIRELVTYTLNSQGLDAEGFSHPREFWEAMRKAQPSLILLDIMLPEEDGITILQKLRADTIWGYAFDGESRTVDVHVRSLRQKLGPGADCIETVRGIGYKISEA